jgi:cysteinyl-tRNA synthetase
MDKIFLYNTLSREKEEFKTTNPNEVGLYTCGPTVYNFAHIGNLRTYLFEDWLKRILTYNNFQVKHVMNVTDVGHLVGDGDEGEDKMERGAAREGKSAWEIADFYLAAFKTDLEHLNIISPTIWCKVTDYIPEQIELIKVLEQKGFAYKISDGVYFDTSRFPDYNKLSRLKLSDLAEGARVEINSEKRNPTDFALWKFSPLDSKRQMEWSSPWGTGFPGWHIECSALSLKFLGDKRDIHCGGADHINVHHTNEIAQSEAATGEKYFNYWLHGAFLNVVGGKKMAKSDDNFLTVDNALIKKDLHPLAYRFAAASVHYRKPMEYSEESLRQAQNGWKNLLKQIASLDDPQGEINKLWQDSFKLAINDDLNIPQALAITQDLLKSDLSKGDKLATVLDFDKVLGLGFNLAESLMANEILFDDLSTETKNLVEARKQARLDKDFAESDRLRNELKSRGIAVEDTKDGMKFTSI